MKNAMKKIDFRKTFKRFYGPSANEVVAVDVPAMRFLMIDGQGDPGDSPEFTQAVEALYPLAYTLHRLSSRHHEIYLSDMRRTAPERLRTVIRQPYA